MTDKLIAGFQKFRKEEYEGRDALMPRLVEEGQSPEYFAISCIDSRANPATIFQAAPGTFFAFKAMGAIVRPYKKGTALSAALQFALTHMKVGKLIVLGHTQCGAVKALADNTKDKEIASFIDVCHKCYHRAQDICGLDARQEELLRTTEEQIVLNSLENLKGYPSVALALKEKRLEMKGWVFDMKQGQLLEYDPGIRHFTPISNHPAHTSGERCC